MPLELQIANESDALQAVTIERRAYGVSPVSQALFPGPSQNLEDRAAKWAQSLREDPSCRWVKVVDTELQAQDPMVAFAAWYIWDKPKAKGSIAKPEWGLGTNPEACERFFGGMMDKREELMGGKPYIYLKYLHTDPTYQRRGIASMLIAWGLAESRRLNISAYLEASPEGLPLYERHGFVTAQRLVTDLSPWGGPPSVETPLMLREV